MKILFTTDYKNYKPEWPSSCRPSARAVILIEGTPLDFNPNDSSKIILKPEDKIALVYAKNLGYYTAPKICLTHSFNLKDVDDYIGKVDISEEQMQELKQLLEKTEFDDYDRMIQLLDSTCGADGTKNLEQRMNDVKVRYGYYPQSKWEKNFELKEYFEKLTGRDLYEIIK